MSRFLSLSIFLLAFTPLSAQKDSSLILYFGHQAIEPVDFSGSFNSGFLQPNQLVKLISVHITGYCDDQGSTAFNDSLSVWRARKVKSLLLQAGLADGIPIFTEGKGELISQTSMNIDAARKENRKVEVVFSYKPLKPLPIRVKHMESLFDAELPEGSLFTLENIYFPAARHVLLPKSYATLKVLVQLLQANPTIQLDILGHVCCERNGQDSFDMDSQTGNLSVNRAKAVYDYLVHQGVDHNRLNYYGMKSAFKLGLGDEQDMRVEVRLRKP